MKKLILKILTGILFALVVVLSVVLIIGCVAALIAFFPFMLISGLLLLIMAVIALGIVYLDK